MLYKNRPAVFMEDQQLPALLGPQVLHPRKIIMARRNISPKTIETIYLSNGPREHALPILHIQGLFNLENIVRVDDDSTSQSRDKSSSPQQVPTPHELGVHCKPISNSVLREPRQIPHRIDERSRVPSIRTLPSDLYTVLGAKTSGPIASTPAENGRPPFPPPGLAKVPYPREREPPRTKAQCSPIGSDRYEWSSPFLGTAADVGLSAEPTVCPSPGSRTAPRKAPDLMLPFVDILSENKRKNPHAPAMVSMFNPLRGDVRFRAWASMAVQRAGRKPVGGLTLPSARFQTSLYAIPARSRAECDLAANRFRSSKDCFLKKTGTHCRRCKQDTICKKLLVLTYFGRQFRFLYGPPEIRMDMDDRECHVIEISAPNQNNYDMSLLNSPTLCDSDDFNDAIGDSGDDYYFDNDAIIMDDVDMAHLTLF